MQLPLRLRHLFPLCTIAAIGCHVSAPPPQPQQPPAPYYYPPQGPPPAPYYYPPPQGPFGTAPGPAPQYFLPGAVAPPPGTWPSPEAEAETYEPRAARQHARAPLALPGTNELRFVAYDTVGSEAVLEGDIMLGPVNELLSRYGTLRGSLPDLHTAVASNNKAHLWPRGEIAYVIEPSAAGKRSSIEWAVAQINSQTELKIRPRTNEVDYVKFRGTGSGCSSYIGRQGGGQGIQIADCSKGSIIHEILHAVGFYHEQSRSDRDSFITIMWSEIDEGFRDNFEKNTGRTRDIGDYDYGSIMHYSAKAFSRRGRETIVVRTPGIKIGQREGLSPRDKAAVRVLYGGASPTPPAPTTPTPTPAPIPRPTPMPMPPPSPGAGLTGFFMSTRGPMACLDRGMQVSCNFNEAGANGRLDCGKYADGLNLGCTWSTSGPRTAQGTAVFRRWSAADRNLSGTWGFSSNVAGGTWSIRPL